MNKNFILKEFIIFIIFGLMYVTIELLYRGHTHYSMFIVGGICGVLIGLINDNTPDMPLLPQCILGAIIITIIELLIIVVMIKVIAFIVVVMIMLMFVYGTI